MLTNKATMSIMKRVTSLSYYDASSEVTQAM